LRQRIAGEDWFFKTHYIQKNNAHEKIIEQQSTAAFSEIANRLQLYVDAKKEEKNVLRILTPKGLESLFKELKKHVASKKNDFLLLENQS
jgi:hypothetical protein